MTDRLTIVYKNKVRSDLSDLKAGDKYEWQEKTWRVLTNLPAKFIDAHEVTMEEIE